MTGPAPADQAKTLPRPEYTAAPTPPASIPSVPPVRAAQPGPARGLPAKSVQAEAPVTATATIRTAEKEEAGTSHIAKSRPAAAAHGMMIQIGATDNMDKAKELLDRAKSRSAGQLASAKPFTEQITKDGGTLYRARFAGLDEKSAEAACRTLKRSGLGCFTTKN